MGTKKSESSIGNYVMAVILIMFLLAVCIVGFIILISLIKYVSNSIEERLHHGSAVEFCEDHNLTYDDRVGTPTQCITIIGDEVIKTRHISKINGRWYFEDDN